VSPASPSAGLVVSLRLADSRWRGELRDIVRFSRRTLSFAASRMGVVGGVDLLYSGDEEIRALNAAWRGRDSATDILSFPGAMQPPPGEIPHLGDLILAYETSSRDAVRMGRPLRAHLAHLLVHGFLHLLGYDHETEPEAERMERLETEILHEMGYPDPYVMAS
jgi:probable rRNA maturation factor